MDSQSSLEADRKLSDRCRVVVALILMLPKGRMIVVPDTAGNPKPETAAKLLGLSLAISDKYGSFSRKGES